MVAKEKFIPILSKIGYKILYQISNYQAKCVGLFTNKEDEKGIFIQIGRAHV
jgi:hypothetical protein